MTKNNCLKKLPPNFNMETAGILKKVARASRALAELKGISHTIPNSQILINTLILQEAKDSSAVENIITTHDELFKSDIDIGAVNHAAKEVRDYSRALKAGFKLVKENGYLITRHLIQIQEFLEKNHAGLRKLPGTVIQNPSTKEIMHTPPQKHDEIVELMGNLEEYINNDSDDIDPLIKMAVIHYQFESIHPFYDGNGRTGRIINVLYLVLKGLLDIPVLYLSRYIIKHKSKYYKLLQKVRTENNWEDWILYMLEGVEITARETIILIEKIKELMAKTEIILKTEIPKIYTKDLLEILFLHPYTKIEFLVKHLGVSRQTASTYLEKIEKAGVLKKEKIERYNFYINVRLFDLLSFPENLNT